MSKIKVKISETKFLSFYQTMDIPHGSGNLESETAFCAMVETNVYPKVNNTISDLLLFDLLH